MSIIRRLALVLKSYLSAVENRLDAIAQEETQSEAELLRNAMEELKSSVVTIEQTPNSNSPSSLQPAPFTHVSQTADLAADYRILGLTPNADLAAVETAWRNLASRADPKRFPAGSEEEKRAAQLLKLINAAYARIREAVIPTEGRFGRLEL